MAFDEETTDVLIGGYLSADAAKEDYEAVLQCGARLWGAVVVSKGLDGELSVEETDHMVEEGADGLASVGFVVGLFAPPLLAATAIGAALGAAGGGLLHKRAGSKIEEAAGETIPIGGAGLIVAYKHADAEQVEPAVTRAFKKVVGEAEGHHVKALKGALADAQQKMAEEGARANRPLTWTPRPLADSGLDMPHHTSSELPPGDPNVVARRSRGATGGSAVQTFCQLVVDQRPAWLLRVPPRRRVPRNGRGAAHPRQLHRPRLLSGLLTVRWAIGARWRAGAALAWQQGSSRSSCRSSCTPGSLSRIS